VEGVEGAVADLDAEGDDDNEDPSSTAREALKLAVHVSRSVFSTVVTKLVEGIVSTLQSAAAGGDEDAHAEDHVVWMQVATSLLNRTMRAYVSAERGLAKGQGRTVVLSLARDKLAELFADLPVVQNTWDSQLV
jgi:hypothetical protein